MSFSSPIIPPVEKLNKPIHSSVEELLREQDVAKLLNVSVRTVQAWRLKGVGLRFIALSSKAIRYRHSDVSAFLESCAKLSTSA